MRSRSNYDIKMGVKSNMRAKMRLYISRELINDFATKREGHNSDDFHNFYRYEAGNDRKLRKDS